MKKKGYKKVYREGRCVCVGWWRFLSTGPRELNYCYYILYIIKIKNYDSDSDSNYDYNL